MPDDGNEQEHVFDVFFRAQDTVERMVALGDQKFSKEHCVHIMKQSYFRSPWKKDKEGHSKFEVGASSSSSSSFRSFDTSSSTPSSLSGMPE